MPEPVIGVVGAGRLGRSIQTLTEAENRTVRLYDPRDTAGPVTDIASLRSGMAVSDHQIQLVWAEQALTLTHTVHSLDAAAAGAIGVADWAASRSHGLCTDHEGFDDMMAVMACHPPTPLLTATRKHP